VRELAASEQLAAEFAHPLRLGALGVESDELGEELVATHANERTHALEAHDVAELGE